MAFKAWLSPIVVITGMLSATGASLAQPLSLVGFGDSLMAGYQLDGRDAYPAKLEAALKAKGYDVSIANAGVSGDTTAGGLERLDWSVPDGTDGVILELGANDALRGVSPDKTRNNLDAMLKRLSDRQIPVLLVGMFAPPNMGGDFGARFNAVFPELARKYEVDLYPFFLDGVVATTGLQLEDGMHPNPKGVDVMVERSLPAVEAFLAKIGGKTK